MSKKKRINKTSIVKTIRIPIEHEKLLAEKKICLTTICRQAVKREVNKITRCVA